MVTDLFSNNICAKLMTFFAPFLVLLGGTIWTLEQHSRQWRGAIRGGVGSIEALKRHDRSRVHQRLEGNFIRAERRRAKGLVVWARRERICARRRSGGAGAGRGRVAEAKKKSEPTMRP